MTRPDPAHAEIETIRTEVENAADAMLSAAMHGLGLVARLRTGDRAVIDDLEATFCAIMEACAFQDLTGQRLSRLKAHGLEVVRPSDALLQGPGGAGHGMTQEAVDRLMNSGELGS